MSTQIVYAHLFDTLCKLRSVDQHIYVFRIVARDPVQ